MSKLLVTGSAGLIGSESVKFFVEKGFDVFGIDNNLRKYFFGADGDTLLKRDQLVAKYKNYRHFDVDIRDNESLEGIFRRDNFDIVIHCAAQPSHDWAAKEPSTDFSVNAVGTFNMLESLRKYCPGAVFIFTSTNKVYGDTPNALPLVELSTRYELPVDHAFYNGIDETMSIDQSKHSIFGASKVAADVMTQEYGRYFGLKTGVFRGGCLTGPAHSAAELHGFLAYLVKCIAEGREYKIFGYKGKQVRDNIHSYDLVNMFWRFYQNPRAGEVYNAGGSRHSNISVIEAISQIENVLHKRARYTYVDQNRIGDHIWYISSVEKFKDHFPEWQYKYGIHEIIEEMCKAAGQ